jgi:hypothetical protein
MAALLAAALQRLAASWGPHANAESMRLSPTPSVRLICTFQISLLPTLNLLIGSDRYNNLAADSSQGARTFGLVRAAGFLIQPDVRIGKWASAVGKRNPSEDS